MVIVAHSRDIDAYLRDGACRACDVGEWIKQVAPFDIYQEIVLVKEIRAWYGFRHCSHVESPFERAT